MRLCTVVLLAALLTGCAFKKSIQQGTAAESTGDHWSAAQHYLDALDRKPRHEDANLAIRRVGDDALSQAISSAEREETSEDFLNAVSWYEQALQYTQRVQTTANLSLTTTVDLPGKISEMRAAAAFEAYADGERALVQRQWEDAIERFDESQHIVPNFKDADLRIAEVHYSWGEQDVSSGQYRVAAGRFQEAMKSSMGPFQDAEDRALELYAALGRHHLAIGTCRQAVRDLRIAHAVYAQDLAGDMQQAEACAFTAVSLERFRSGENVYGIDAGDWVEEYIRERFDEATGEFTYLVAPGVVRGTHNTISVRGTIRDAQVDEPEATAVEQVLRGTNLRDCNEGESGPCTEEVPIRWMENNSTRAVRFGSLFQIIDGQTGQDLGTTQPSGSASSSLRWASDFRKGSGQRAQIAATASTGVFGVGTAMIELRDAPKRHPLGATMVREALTTIGHDALTRIVEVADTEPPLRDPTQLSVSAFNK